METLSLEGLKKRLIFDNPWWALQDGSSQKFRQPPHRIFYDGFASMAENQDPGRVLILAGPRRGGKTVMMRQRVAHLLETGVQPRSVLYCNLSIPTYWDEGLMAIVDLFAERNAEAKTAPLYAFLDEAEYVPGWREDLPAIAAKYPHIRVVCALSAGCPSADEIAKEQEPFDTYDLPPVTFAEYLKFRWEEEKLFGQTADTGRLEFHQQYLGALNKQFENYINYGGFPESVMSKSPGAPSPTFVRDALIERLLHKDLASLFGISDMAGLSRLFTLLAYNTANEVSVEDLAKATGIAKNTLRKYLDYLESAWLIKRLHRVDKNAKRFQRAVAFKVYLTSASWYTALFGPVDMDDRVFGRLAETAIYGQLFGTSRIESLTYASWRGGKIDMVGFPSLQEQSKRAPEPDLILELDWDHHLSGPGRGPVTVAEFSRLNNPGQNASTYLLSRSVIRTGRFQNVPMQVLPASLYCYGLVQEVMHHD